MHRIFYLLFFLVLLHIRLDGQQCYTLVWADEFDGSGSPEAATWTCEQGASGWGNNEVQNYTNSTDNARMENGNMVIEAKKVGNQWTSARLISAGKKTFTYGRIEFRAKLPQGSGTWPALWMLGSELGTVPWPACGEIDIMEHVGKNPGQVHSSLHTTSSSGNTQNTGITQVQNLFTEFHIFRFDWTADSLKFYVDSKLFYTYAPSIRTAQNWPFNKPFFLIMNVAMGGNWGSDPQYETGGLKNGIDPALTSVKMEVDYVRVYQISAKPEMKGPKVIDAAQTGTFSVPVTDALNYLWEVPSNAEIINGQHTSQVNVKWGNSSGNVKLTLTTACQTFVVDPISVRSRITPDTSAYHLPLLVAEQNNWGVATSPGNFLSITQNSDLAISYQISQPLNNPKLTNSFANIFNFSSYKYLVTSLKAEQGNLPSIVRLDLVDINNNVNLDKILKITNFSNTNTFAVYAAEIAASSSFDLSNITGLNIYINYGIFGKADTGNIYINDIFLAENFALSAPELEINAPSIYPNPANHSFSIKNLNPGNFSVKVLNSNGIEVFQSARISNPILCNHFKRGVYFVLITDAHNSRYTFKLIKQ